MITCEGKRPLPKLILVVVVVVPLEIYILFYFASLLITATLSTLICLGSQALLLLIFEILFVLGLPFTLFNS